MEHHKTIEADPLGDGISTNEEQLADIWAVDLFQERFVEQNSGFVQKVRQKASSTAITITTDGGHGPRLLRDKLAASLTGMLCDMTIQLNETNDDPSSDLCIRVAGVMYTDPITYHHARNSMVIQLGYLRLLFPEVYSTNEKKAIDTILGTQNEENNLVLGCINRNELSIPALKKILQDNTFSNVIIIPSNPASIWDIENELHKSQIHFHRFSEENLNGTQVLVVDFFGHAGKIYQSSASRVAMIGGGYYLGRESHTPTEALMAGCSTVIGPNHRHHNTSVSLARELNMLAVSSSVSDAWRLVTIADMQSEKNTQFRDHLITHNYQEYERLMVMILNHLEDTIH